MRALPALYRQQFKTSLAVMLQYRASLVIWLISHLLEPLVYLVVWSAVATARGGSVGGYGSAEFASYFILLMLVNHVTYTWVMYEYEYRVRHGSLSFALLRPVHPIHADLADNISSKIITLPLILVAAAVLAADLPARVAYRAVGRGGLRPGGPPGVRRPLPHGMDARSCRVLDHARERDQPACITWHCCSSPDRWLPWRSCRGPSASWPRSFRSAGPRASRSSSCWEGWAGRRRSRALASRPRGFSCASCSCGWSGGRACACSPRWVREETRMRGPASGSSACCGRSSASGPWGSLPTARTSSSSFSNPCWSSPRPSRALR